MTRICAGRRVRFGLVAAAIGVVAFGADACVAMPAPTATNPGTDRPSLPVQVTPQVSSPVPIATPTAVAPSSAWTIVGRGDPASSTQFRSVVATKDGFIVVGSAGQAGEVAVAFHSPDGATWASEDITGRGTAPDLVLAWGDRAFAVGVGQTSRCAHPGSEIDTWVRSPDGTWTEAPFDPLLCSGGETMAPVILGGRPWLAGDGTGDVPFLMESRDGLSWTDRRARLAGDVFLERAAVDPSGLWLIGHAPADDTAVILRSQDGRMMRSAPLRDASGSPLAVISAVTIDSRLVVLVNRDDAVFRLTPDGSDQWTETAVTGFPTDDVTGIQPTGGPVVAFTSHEAGLPGIYASADGAAWHAVPVPTEIMVGAWPASIAVGHGVAVLVGQLKAPVGNALVGAIWTAPVAILGG